MKTKSRKIYGRNCFDEITNPKKLFEFQEQNLIGIAHSYYGQWSGRHINTRKECLSLYKSDSLELVAHIDSLKYPVNDVDYHEKKKLILIGTGSYDGGYFFEGELLIFDLKSKSLIKIIEDNREFTKCKFIGNEIEFIVNPTHDLDNEDYTNKSYKIPLDTLRVFQLKDLNPIKIQPHDENSFNYESYQERLQEIPNKLSNYCNQLNKNFIHKSLAWDIVFFGDDKLLIGYSNGKIGILEILNEKIDIKSISKNGECAQVFINIDTEVAIINRSYRHIDSDNHNTVYEYNTSTGMMNQVANGTFMLSKSNSGKYLARQTDYQNKNRNDIIFDSSFKKIMERRLGHYDLFNHYIRIDNSENLYALVGNPKEQHQNKRLIEINPSTLSEQTLFELERQPNHYNNLNGILSDDIFIIEGNIYNPNPYQKNYELRGIKKNGEVIWRRELSNQSTGMTTLDEYPNQVAISLTSGETLIMNKLTGETTTIPKSKEVNGYPLSISNKGNKIAIGYDNGLIEIIEIEKKTAGNKG